jgi:hypothetical protein
LLQPGEVECKIGKTTGFLGDIAMAKKDTGDSISVGGDVTGAALVTGRRNIATVIYTGTDAPERQPVLEALAAIQTELARLPGPKAPVAAALTATSVEAATKEQPDKQQIGNFLETALKTGREIAEYAGVTEKLLPYVQTVTSWLGGEWTRASPRNS